MYVIRKSKRYCMLLLDVGNGKVYSPIAKCSPSCPVCREFEDMDRVDRDRVPRVAVSMVACYGTSARGKTTESLKIISRLPDEVVESIFRLYEMLVSDVMQRLKVDRLKAMSVAERVLSRVLRDLMLRYVKYVRSASR